jgi:hypothetical protein
MYHDIVVHATHIAIDGQEHTVGLEKMIATARKRRDSPQQVPEPQINGRETRIYSKKRL